MRTSGTAVVFSGLTVVLALLALWLVPVRAVQSMAAGAMMVVTRRRAGVVDPAARAPAPARAARRPRPDPPPGTAGARPARRVLGRAGSGGSCAGPLVWFCASAGLLDRAHAARDRARDRQPHARADAPVVADRRRERHPVVADHRAGAGRGRGDLDPASARSRATSPHSPPAARRVAAEVARDPPRPGPPRSGGLETRSTSRRLIRVDPESEPAENTIVPRLRTGDPRRPDRAGGDGRRRRRLGVQLRPEPGGRLRPVDGDRRGRRARVRACSWCCCARCSCRSRRS